MIWPFLFAALVSSNVCGFSLSGITTATSVPQGWDCSLPSSPSTIQASSSTKIYILFAWQAYTSGMLELRIGSRMGGSQTALKISSLPYAACYKLSYGSLYLWTMLQSDRDMFQASVYLDSVLQGTATVAINGPPFSAALSLLPGANADCSQLQNVISSKSILTVEQLADGFVTICCSFQGYDAGAPIFIEMVNHDSGYTSNISSLTTLTTRYNGFFKSSREIGYLIGNGGVGPSLFRVKYRGQVYDQLTVTIATQCIENCLRPPVDVFHLPFNEGESWTIGGSPHGRGDMFASSNENLALSSSTQQIVQSTPANMHYTAIDLSRSDWGRSSPLNWTVIAAAGGTVLSVSSCRIEIDHGYGWKTLYYHISNPIVKVADSVARGQRIANVAATKSDALCEGGAWSGPHVHFQLTWFGIGAIDGSTLSGYNVHSGRYSYDSNCNFAYLADYARLCNQGNLLDSDKICVGRSIPPNPRPGVGANLNDTRRALAKNGPVRIYVEDSLSAIVPTPQRYLNLTSNVCIGVASKTSFITKPEKTRTSLSSTGTPIRKKLSDVSSTFNRLMRLSTSLAKLPSSKSSDVVAPIHTPRIFVIPEGPPKDLKGNPAKV